MKFNEYIKGVNKTWKAADGLQEMVHCRLALQEELGEIAGWYKKWLGYGRERDQKWRTELKGEFGDLLYYITKTAEKTRNLELLDSYILEEIEVSTEDRLRILKIMGENVAEIIEYSEHSEIFVDALVSLFLSLIALIKLEEFEVEDIQLSNLSKLQTRHGNSFSQESCHEENRNRGAENKALL